MIQVLSMIQADRLIALCNDKQKSTDVIFDAKCIAHLRHNIADFKGICVEVGNGYVAYAYPIVNNGDVVSLSEVSIEQHDAHSIDYIKRVDAVLYDYKELLNNQLLNALYINDDDIVAPSYGGRSFIIKPGYAVRSADSPRKDKTDIQSRECFAIANMIDCAGIHKYKTQVIVDDASTYATTIKSSMDVAYCSLDYANKNLGHEVLYVVCAASTKEMLESELFAKHKAFIESWVGTIVWLYYDLRLVPYTKGFNLHCSKFIVATQAYNLEYIKDMLFEHGVQYDELVHITLEAIPMFAEHNTDTLPKLSTTYANGKYNVAMPMVSWNDMCESRKSAVKALLSNNNFNVHVVGNINNATDVSEHCVYDGTIKYYDMLTYLSQFDFAYILCEDNMKHAKAVTFRIVESMLANLVCFYADNAVMPECLTSYNNLQHVHNVNVTDFVKKHLTVDKDVDIIKDTLSNQNYVRCALDIQYECLQHIKNECMRDLVNLAHIF